MSFYQPSPTGTKLDLVELCSKGPQSTVIIVWIDG